MVPPTAAHQGRKKITLPTMESKILRVMFEDSWDSKPSLLIICGESDDETVS